MICPFVKVAWRLLHSLHGLAIFTLVKPNDVYFTGFVIVKLIAQDPFHWLSTPFPLFFIFMGSAINNYTTMDYCLQGGLT